MLSIYIKSVIIYWIILSAVMKLAKINIKNENINLKDYIGKETNVEKGLSLLLISLIPIYRLGIFLVALFIAVSKKETLDRIFKEGETDDR